MEDLLGKITDAFGKNKRYITLTIVAYILICVLIITIIWWPKKDNNIYYEEVNISIKQEKEAQRYIDIVSDILKKDKKSDLKDLISDNYVKYTNTSKEDIISSLDEDGYFSSQTEVRGMNVYTDDNTYIYSTTIYSSDGNSKRVNIIEPYPYQYTVVFDDFYNYYETSNSSIVQNIRFTIKGIYKNLKYIEYDFQIENMNNSYVGFNFNDVTQIQAITEDGKVYNTANLASTTSYTTVESNSIINKKLAFEIPVQLQNGIKYIRFKNVTLEYSSSNIEIEVQ